MKHYASFKDARMDGCLAAYVVDYISDSLVKVRFLHLDSEGVPMFGATDGYSEEYRRDGNGWYYTHCGFGTGCFWTEPEGPDGRHPFMGCKRGDILM